MLKKGTSIEVKETNMLRFGAFALGFIGLAWGTALGITRAVYHFGIMVNPKVLTMTGIFGLMVVVAAVYARFWRGFLLKSSAARPRISLKRDVIGLEPLAPNILKTVSGLRAFYEVSLPLAEFSNLERQTTKALRILLKQKTVTGLCFENGAPSNTYKIDDGCESGIKKLIGFDNDRLDTIPARGVVTLQLCVSVDSKREAAMLASESKLIQPLNWQDYGKGFFPPSLLGPDQCGAVTVCDAVASRVPAKLEIISGDFLPVVITGYDEDFTHTYNHKRVQDLERHLGRKVLWHWGVFDVEPGEIRRIKRVCAIESAYPKSFLDSETAEKIKGAVDEKDELAKQLESAKRPKVLRQTVWIALRDDDDAKLVNRIVKEWLFERNLLSGPLNPTSALSAFASMHPGLERFAANSEQGLGIIGEENEIHAEMEPLGSWTGHDSPNLMLEDFSGKTLSLNLFSGGNNYNCVIVGEPGSGKSVVINGLTASHLCRSRFNRAILVDYGGSFSGLVSAAGGFQISHKDRENLSISPIPVFSPMLNAHAFSKAFPGESYKHYLAEQTSLRTEVRKQSFVFLRDYVCSAQINDNAVFKEAFFNALETFATEGQKLADIIETIIKHAGEEAKRQEKEIVRRAYLDLENMFVELRSVCKFSPFIGDNKIDLRQSRLTSFNLDGFAEEDKNTLVGLINLLIHQTFGDPIAGMTFIVFDEVHKFIRKNDGSASGLGEILDSTSRVTRKYGASLILASQSPSDYDKIPSLIENANHHIIMRLKSKDLGPEWKITDPHILDHARTKAEPADAVGYSTIHLGTTSKMGDLQGVFKYKFTPLALYPFTSKIVDKNLMDIACHLTGVTSYIDLADVVHEDRTKLVPIGSATFWNRLKPHFKTEYALVAQHALKLFEDKEVNPYMDLFLKKNRAAFEQTSKNATSLESFMVQNYGKELL